MFDTVMHDGERDHRSRRRLWIAIALIGVGAIVAWFTISNHLPTPPPAPAAVHDTSPVPLPK